MANEDQDQTTPKTTPQSPIVTQLNDLAGVSDSNVCDAFMNSLETIFANPLPDVQETLELLSKETLAQLEKILIKKVKEVFPEYGDRKPINRLAKHKMANDITILGYSLCDESPMRDLDKVFHPALSSEQGNQRPTSASEIAELLSVIAALSDRVEKLEEEVSSLRSSQRSTETSERSEQAAADSQSDSAQPSDAEDDEGTFQTAKSKKRRKKRNNPRVQVPQSQSSTQPAPPPDNPTEQRLSPPATTAAGASSITNPCPTQSPALRPASTEQQPIALQAARPATPNSTPASVDIYVGRIDGGNNTKDLKSHLVRIGAQPSQIRLLKDRDNIKSFCVTVPLSMKDTVLSPSHWADGIRVRPFRDSGSWNSSRPRQNWNRSHPNNNNNTHWHRQRQSSWNSYRDDYQYQEWETPYWTQGHRY